MSARCSAISERTWLEITSSPIASAGARWNWMPTVMAVASTPAANAPLNAGHGRSIARACDRAANGPGSSSPRSRARMRCRTAGGIAWRMRLRRSGAPKRMFVGLPMRPRSARVFSHRDLRHDAVIVADDHGEHGVVSPRIAIGVVPRRRAQAREAFLAGGPADQCDHVIGAHAGHDRLEGVVVEDDVRSGLAGIGCGLAHERNG